MTLATWERWGIRNLHDQPGNTWLVRHDCGYETTVDLGADNLAIINAPSTSTSASDALVSPPRCPMPEPLSAYDLRLRSLDDDEDVYLCSRCDRPAPWSVWLHTPEWMPEGGATYVLCTSHALAAVADEGRTEESMTAPKSTPCRLCDGTRVVRECPQSCDGSHQDDLLWTCICTGASAVIGPLLPATGRDATPENETP